MNPDAVLDLKTALVAAARDGAGRPRAMSALRGSELWAASWPGRANALRTLTNSAGVTALPLFSDERELHEAGVRYGWVDVDGRVEGQLLPLPEALRAAKRQRAQLVVIDLASDHALELDEGEMDLLSASHSTRPPPKVRSTPPPPRDIEVKRASGRPEEADPLGSPYSALRPRSITPAYGTHTVSATFGAVATATMASLAHEPHEMLLDALTDVLRGYPEVEWACLVSSSHTERAAQDAVALRVDPEFRKNLGEITQKLREASSQHGPTYDVLLLDTSEQMKQARTIGMPFYPWRKK